MCVLRCCCLAVLGIESSMSGTLALMAFGSMAYTVSGRVNTKHVWLAQVSAYSSRLHSSSIYLILISLLCPRSTRIVIEYAS